MTADECRPVVVYGEVIRVRSALPMTEEDVVYLTEIVRAAKRRFADELRACPECEQGKCRNCSGDTWDNDADDYAPCPCAARGHRADPDPDDDDDAPYEPEQTDPRPVRTAKIGGDVL